ncbi:hypothetical protein O181_101056, partial [Austropuccinia psidii MF-1]|nr:hypothetical protein [Austropuccinia psidii MF-1]
MSRLILAVVISITLFSSLLVNGFPLAMFNGACSGLSSNNPATLVIRSRSKPFLIPTTQENTQNHLETRKIAKSGFSINASPQYLHKGTQRYVNFETIQSRIHPRVVSWRNSTNTSTPTTTKCHEQIEEINPPLSVSGCTYLIKMAGFTSVCRLDYYSFSFETIEHEHRRAVDYMYNLGTFAEHLEILHHRPRDELWLQTRFVEAMTRLAHYIWVMNAQFDNARDCVRQ